MAATVYRWEEFTSGKIFGWIFFVVLALVVASVTAWYGRERFVGSGSSNGPSTSSYSAPTTAVVKAQQANLRDDHRLTANVIDSVYQGETLTLIGDPVGPWYRVRRSSGTEGWVHGNTIDVK